MIDAQVKIFARKFDFEEQQVISDNLKRKKNRTYLWLFLTVDIIQKSGIKYSKPSSIYSLLSELPNEISDAYEMILNRSEDAESAKLLLQIIVAATRPLTLQEANIALALATHHEQGSSHKELDLWPSEVFSSIAKNICGLLVTTREGKLYVLHQTVREFLIVKTPAITPIATQQMNAKGSVNSASTPRNWKGCLYVSSAYGLMCQICLNYLMLSDFAIQIDKYGNGNKEGSSTPSDVGILEPVETRACSSENAKLMPNRLPEDFDLHQIMPVETFVGEAFQTCHLLGYAALNWAHHYRQQDLEHRSILYTDAELICDPSSTFYFTWASVFTNDYDIDLLSGIDRLGVASYFGLNDVVESFSSQAQDIDAIQEKGGIVVGNCPALMIAIKRGFPDVVRVLLEKGADPSWGDGYQTGPLECALQSNRLDIVQLLLEAGLDID